MICDSQTRNALSELLVKTGVQKPLVVVLVGTSWNQENCYELKHCLLLYILSKVCVLGASLNPNLSLQSGLESKHSFFLFLAFQPTSRFPPDLLVRIVCSIRMLWLTALTMSYTVSAATVAPVRASISTPVLWVTRHSQVMIAILFFSNWISICTLSSGKGWHRGIKSLVFLVEKIRKRQHAR